MCSTSSFTTHRLKLLFTSIVFLERDLANSAGNSAGNCNLNGWKSQFYPKYKNIKNAYTNELILGNSQLKTSLQGPPIFALDSWVLIEFWKKKYWENKLLEKLTEVDLMGSHSSASPYFYTSFWKIWTASSKPPGTFRLSRPCIVKIFKHSKCGSIGQFSRSQHFQLCSRRKCAVNSEFCYLERPCRRYCVS